MSTTPATPTGRRETRGGTSHLVLERTFRAPIEAVWAAVTEPGRMERWIGTWSGDPASGSVDFRMTAEGDDVPVEVYLIDVCDRPRRLVARSSSEDAAAVWHLSLDLTESEGVTTLVFAQALGDPAQAENVGPGWEYYLDRLVAAETGGSDVTADDVVWDAYYPAQADHYRAMFSD